jgi:hypothetical protein
MDPIQVPAPPRAAYNPNRRVSDLILGQLKHFQHVETKHGHLGIDPAVARDIHTEAGAARYIAAITRALRGQTSAKPAKLATMPAAKVARKPVPLALAASAATPPAAKKTVKKAAAKKPSKPGANIVIKRKK